MDTKHLEKYGFKIYLPSGDFFAYCTRKRYNQYIKKKLCKTIDDRTIQLTIEPKSNASPANFVYVRSQDGYDTCACCATEENLEEDVRLNNQCIVSKEFTKWIPDKKNFCNKNVILLCTDCQAEFSSKYHKYRIELYDKYKIDLKDKSLIHGKLLVEKIITDNALDKFCKEFLSFFVTSMQPINLPKYIEV